MKNSKKTIRLFQKNLLTLLLFSSVMCNAQWQDEPNPPQYNDLNSITDGYFLDKYFAVGDEGTIISAKKDIWPKWEIQNSGTTKNLLYVTCINKNIIAVGDSGILLSSSDGINWSVKYLNTNAGYIHKLFYSYSLKKYFAFGGGWRDYYVYSSTDLNTWDSNKIECEGFVTDVIDNDLSIMITTSDGEILTSEDGEKWTKQDSNFEGYLSSVIWDAGSWSEKKYLAVGYTSDGESYILKSSDGKEWSKLDLNAKTYCKKIGICPPCLRYIVVGYDKVLTSKDAVVWVSEYIGNDLNDCLFGKRCVAVGSQGKIMYGNFDDDF